MGIVQRLGGVALALLLGSTVALAGWGSSEEEVVAVNEWTNQYYGSPSIALLPDNSVYHYSYDHVCLLDSAGDEVWSTNVATGQYGQIFAGEDGGAYLVTITEIWDIRAQKISSEGELLWGESGVFIGDLGLDRFLDDAFWGGINVKKENEDLFILWPAPEENPHRVTKVDGETGTVEYVITVEGGWGGATLEVSSDGAPTVYLSEGGWPDEDVFSRFRYDVSGTLLGAESVSLEDLESNITPLVASFGDVLYVVRLIYNDVFQLIMRVMAFDEETLEPLWSESVEVVGSYTIQSTLLVHEGILKLVYGRLDGNRLVPMVSTISELGEVALTRAFAPSETFHLRSLFAEEVNDGIRLVMGGVQHVNDELHELEMWMTEIDTRQEIFRNMQVLSFLVDLSGDEMVYETPRFDAVVSRTNDVYFACNLNNYGSNATYEYVHRSFMQHVTSAWTFGVQEGPWLAIDEPGEQETVIEADTLRVACTVGNFVLGAGGGGYLHVTNSSELPELDSYEPEFVLRGLPSGEWVHFRIELMTSVGEALDPPVVELLSVYRQPQTGNSGDEAALALETTLSAAYPNPFNSSTIVRFSLNEGSYVKLNIVDVLGREVGQLERSYVAAGKHVRHWEAGDLPSGIYFVRLETGKQRLVQKVLLIK